MIIYKFKTSFEDYDDFLREIELRADQTFEDFHQAILGNLGLDPGMLASFFICDHRFRKQKEIQLTDIDPAAPVGEEEEEDEAPGTESNVLLMHECFLKDYIDDPHQRLLFVYDYLNRWTFYIELVKIMPAGKNQTYPRFSKSRGPVPLELVATPKQIPGVETPKDFSYGDGDAPLADLSDFDQIKGGEEYFGDDPGLNTNDDDQNE